MEVPIPEVVDRITILWLKINHSENPIFKEELRECENFLKEIEKRGIKIKRERFNELYKINKSQWELESSLNEARKNKENLGNLGKNYIELQISNKKRVAIKNKIIEETGSGFKDIKIN